MPEAVPKTRTGKRMEGIMNDVWAKAPLEPSLDDLLAEPIVRMLMARDGVHAQEMRHELRRVSTRSSSRFHP